ncbi:DedA family protein [Cytobacillus sp. FSL W7-1323]|uniref:DedA family protein n=1 Tax=unclassified Cytobacillus TaxID=2675268 RepID=UPI002AFFCC83|nr:DedA family protein [Cytobacillus sp. OWB-43]MEA1854025.1 DedA family protein [Cytobacillus sp. OWB-43]
MENWITSVIEQFGYVGIFLLIMLENIFPPIPSEVILTFGGFMTTTTNLSVAGVVVASTLGSVGGAVVLYGVGLLIDIRKVERIVERWGHILRLTKKDIHKANGWFSTYGKWTVFFCRFIPLIRSLISLPAGMAHMNFLVFLILTTAGTLIWNIVLVLIGAAVGESWESVVGYMDMYSYIVYGAIALVFIVIVMIFLKKRVFHKK